MGVERTWGDLMSATSESQQEFYHDLWTSSVKWMLLIREDKPSCVHTSIGAVPQIIEKLFISFLCIHMYAFTWRRWSNIKKSPGVTRCSLKIYICFFCCGICCTCAVATHSFSCWRRIKPGCHDPLSTSMLLAHNFLLQFKIVKWPDDTFASVWDEGSGALRLIGDSKLTVSKNYKCKCISLPLETWKHILFRFWFWLLIRAA